MPLTVPCTQRRARLHGRDRGRGPEPEVVVPVPVHRDVEAVERARDEQRRGLGRRDPERVDDDDLGGPASTAAAYARSKNSRSARERVDAEERDVDPVARSRTRRPSGSARASSRARRRAPRACRRRSGSRSPRRGRRARRARRRRPGRRARSPRPRRGARRAAISSTARKSSSETRGKPASIRSMPGRVERLGDLELLLGRQDDADRLLAVAQRRVVQADRRRAAAGRAPAVDRRRSRSSSGRSCCHPPARCRRGTGRASPARRR